jgi:tetratricopeptide (TPR) repeat protein
MADTKPVKEEYDVVERARGFWAKYSKAIIYIGAAIILIGGGWLIYKYMFRLPQERKANEVVYLVQKNFAAFSTASTDTLKTELAQKTINGEGVTPGSLKIIKNYGGTSAANLSQYYTGACYLHLKQYDKAIKYLKDFSTDATQIKSRAYGMIGDAYSELNKSGDALDYYRKAAEVNKKDDYTSSEFLFRAALYAESLGKTKDAIEMYKKIKTDYPLTEKAADVDRYLARLGDVSE